MRRFKIIVEKYEDGYVAYPIGMKGAVIAQGDTYDEVLQSIKSAIGFHIESFGLSAFEDSGDVLEAFVAEANV